MAELERLKDEIARLRARNEELAKALAVIGERAVVDFDDPTVVEVDKVFEGDRKAYRDAVRELLKQGEDNAERS